MKKNYFIVVLAHPIHGRIKRLHIPHYFLHIAVALLVIGGILAIGFSSSYARMLGKITEFNQLRSEKLALQKQYDQLREESADRGDKLASLGALASEVSIAFGIKREAGESVHGEAATLEDSLNQFDYLQSVQLPSSGSMALHRLTNTTPSIWPIEGRIGSSFGNRVDPFNGEGAFHAGVDFGASKGTPVVATADGLVRKAGWLGSLGKAVVIDHGGSQLTTRYGHMTEVFARPGQVVRRGEVIGRAGSTGRSTSSHLHYEVIYRGTPVNPYKYLGKRDGATSGLSLAD
jgi:murein DD-endopeptidase MepM/ murein hydrolase activator NlpD